jgi:pRiA4b ORF-3-like protein
MKPAKSKKKRTARRTNVIEFVAPGKASAPAEPESRELFSWDLTICQIAVTLQRTDPPIWRRILVHEDIRLPKFHRIPQCVMGWENYHLHEFHVLASRELQSRAVYP